MSKAFVRKWAEEDISKITGSLLLLGAVTCDCANCRHLGIDYASVAVCPSCGAVFKYIAFRRRGVEEHGRFGIVKRIRERRPDLEIIDYIDYKDQTGKSKAQDLLFKKMPQKEDQG